MSTECPTSAENLDLLLKVFALVSAGLFFSWKLIAGWLIINLSLAVSTQRQYLDEQHDVLAITLTLDKGPTDTLRLSSVSVRVAPDPPAPSSTAQTVTFSEVRELQVDSDGNVIWPEPETPRSKKKVITLSPGERTQFARSILVSRDVPYLVEASVTGWRHFWWRYFQWRASAVSLPTEKAAPKS
jgi:hypothetical protein